MLTNKEMKLFVMLNNVDIFLENDKAYVEVKTNLSEEILSNENIIKRKGKLWQQLKEIMVKLNTYVLNVAIIRKNGSENVQIATRGGLLKKRWI